MCLDDQILNTYLDGELVEPWKSQVEEHLSYCKACSDRYNKLSEIRGIVKDAVLTKEEIAPYNNRVLAFMEKNYLSKKKKKEGFFRKQFRVKGQQILGLAAAFVVVFVGSWVVLGNSTDAAIPMPDLNNQIDIESITPVRATDNSTTARSLESYSLDEILKSLDARGYEVELHLKGIQPLSLDDETTADTN